MTLDKVLLNIIEDRAELDKKLIQAGVDRAKCLKDSMDYIRTLSEKVFKYEPNDYLAYYQTQMEAEA